MGRHETHPPPSARLSVDIRMPAMQDAVDLRQKTKISVLSVIKSDGSCYWTLIPCWAVDCRMANNPSQLIASIHPHTAIHSISFGFLFFLRGQKEEVGKDCGCRPSGEQRIPSSSFSKNLFFHRFENGAARWGVRSDPSGIPHLNRAHFNRQLPGKSIGAVK